MRRLLCVAACVALAVPAWPAKKIKVGELEELLKHLHADNKTDSQIAIELKQVQLSEELTRSKMNELAMYAPGPETTEQFYVLEAGSAVLAPPERDIPSQPAMDAATQKALIEKMANYATTVVAQLPAMTATKTTVRFQDNVEATAPNPATFGGGATGSQMHPSQYIRYLGSTSTKAETANGVEKMPGKEKGVKWGANGQITLLAPDPNLPAVVREAQDSGGFSFLRWELVGGKTAAVFTFVVPKKKSHYAVDYCCFPDVSASGKSMMADMGNPMNGTGSAGGSYQSVTDWHDFTNKNLPYHGELFIDPETGVVLRMVTIAEFKSSDVVHQEDRRIDYLPMGVAGKELIVPVQSMINTEVVPNGDTGSPGRILTRRTMLTSEYKDFELVSK